MALRFAVLGAGRIGQVHARAIAGERGANLIAIAADFRAGQKTREEIADLMAGGESMADLEASIEGYMETHDGHPPQVVPAQ